MTAGTRKTAPQGELEQIPLPRLLLALYRERYEGGLELQNGRNQKKFVIQQGAPVFAESNLASETLGALLLNQAVISQKDHDRVSAYMRQKGCKEGVALLALELLSPKELFRSLKDQVRRRMLEAFGWQQGRYALVDEAETELAEDVQPFRSDPLALIQEGLETHWGADRLLTDLMERMNQYPSARKTFKKIALRLRADPAAEHLLTSLDGTRSLGQALGSALNSPRTLAAAWVLDATGALEYRDRPTRSEEATAFDADIEIEIAGTATSTHGQSQEKRATRLVATTRDPGADDEREALRTEIEKLHDCVAELDHYALLGVEEDAKTGAIKKAYFKAAKRFHPDTLARLELTQIKNEAAEVFAKIAEAFEVLSDVQGRKDYDAQLRGELTEIDATRLAQAETSFRKGEILVRMGDFKGALEYLRPAVELWPEECAYQGGLGWALYKQTPSDPAAARQHLEKALEYGPEDAVAHFRLGMVLRAIGDKDGSRRHLSISKDLDPGAG